MTSIKKNKTLPQCTAYSPSNFNYTDFKNNPASYGDGKVHGKNCSVFNNKKLFANKGTVTFGMLSTLVQGGNCINANGDVFFELKPSLGDSSDPVRDKQLKQMIKWVDSVDAANKTYIKSNWDKFSEWAKFGKNETLDEHYKSALYYGENGETGEKYDPILSLKVKFTQEGNSKAIWFDSTNNTKLDINKDNFVEYVRNGVVFKNLQVTYTGMAFTSKKNFEARFRVDKIQYIVSEPENDDCDWEADEPVEAEPEIEMEDAVEDVPDDAGVNSSEDEGEVEVEVEVEDEDEITVADAEPEPEQVKPKRGRKKVTK
jgi:hypothetical protein